MYKKIQSQFHNKDGNFSNIHEKDSKLLDLKEKNTHTIHNPIIVRIFPCTVNKEKLYFIDKKNIAKCAIHAAYRIARHAIPAICANHPVAILHCVVIPAIHAVVTDEKEISVKSITFVWDDSQRSEILVILNLKLDHILLGRHHVGFKKNMKNK
uniref:CSON008589 protein n=1 Tax=Culicoides sonorensis TaxID=179676 RepID=A0A336M4B9_CULSO